MHTYLYACEFIRENIYCPTHTKKELDTLLVVEVQPVNFSSGEAEEPWSGGVQMVVQVTQKILPQNPTPNSNNKRVGYFTYFFLLEHLFFCLPKK